MPTKESIGTHLVATVLGGLLAFGPTWWSTRTQIAAARTSEVRATRLAALSARVATLSAGT